MKKVYKIITDRIISLLKKGTVPWHQTWKDPQSGNFFPKNFVTKREYRGFLNIFIDFQTSKVTWRESAER